MSALARLLTESAATMRLAETCLAGFLDGEVADTEERKTTVETVIRQLLQRSSMLDGVVIGLAAYDRAGMEEAISALSNR